MKIRHFDRPTKSVVLSDVLSFFQIVPLHILLEDEEFSSYMVDSNDRYCACTAFYELAKTGSFVSIDSSPYKE